MRGLPLKSLTKNSAFSRATGMTTRSLGVALIDGQSENCGRAG